MNISIRRAFGCAISALLLVRSAPTLSSPAQAADTVMTQEQAGAYYLTHACNPLKARIRFINKLSRDGRSIRFTDVKERFPLFKREADRLGVAQTKFGTKLLNPPALWPVEVASPVLAVAGIALTSGAILDRAGKASTPAGWWRQFGKANNLLAKIDTRLPKIRALLNLPPDVC